MMPLVDLIIALALLGFLLWVVNSLIPMEPSVRKIMNAVVVVVVVLWMLQSIGLLHGGPRIQLR